MSFDGVHMDIAKQGKEVRIDEMHLITALKKMPSGSQLLTPMPRVAHRYALHDLADRLLADLHQHMRVVGHPTESVNTSAESCDRLGDDLIEHLTVRGGTEQRPCAKEGAGLGLCELWQV